MSAYSRNRRQVWPLIVAGVSVLVLVVGISAGVGWFMGRGASQSPPPTAGETSEQGEPGEVKPTWSLTAEPVPNEYGSYGQNSTNEVARNFVIEGFGWLPDEPQPDGWLSRVRPTVTDTMFQSLLDDGIEVVQWDVDEGVVGRKINVTDVLNEIGDLQYLTVQYEVTDILEDGSEKKHDEIYEVAVELQQQDVQLDQGSGTKTIQEWRVENATTGGAWRYIEED